MRVHPGFPFRRIALVLSGGGAFGAYEVGVLRTLQALGIRPDIIGGASVGAINALAWVAHDGDTAALEQTWRGLRPADVGIRWGVLTLRALGSFLLAFGLVEVLLLLAGLPELAALERLARLRQLGGYVFVTGFLDLLAWIAVAAAGLAVLRLSGPLDDWLGGLLGSHPVRWTERILVAALGACFALYFVALGLQWPWPLRFHLVVLLAMALGWLAQRPGPVRDWLNPIWLRLMPETGGRGLWRNAARRALIRHLVRSGNPARLVMGAPLILINACDLATGRITFFANRRPEAPDFEARLAEAQCDLVVASDVRELTEAAVASSAVPVLFAPARLRGRHYVDGGLFSNQPLAAATAAGADAILLVLVSPSAGPRPASPRSNLVEIAGRLSELANWRDLHAEIRRLPPEFRAAGPPARVCVVEPSRPLEGGMFEFGPGRAQALMRRGEADARGALARAGWTESARPAAAHRT